MLKAIVMVPMIWKGEVIGILNITDNKSDRTFNDNDLPLMESFANLAAFSIGNVREQAYLQSLVDVSPDAIIVGIFADAAIRYLSKCFNDSWMKKQGYMPVLDMETK